MANLIGGIVFFMLFVIGMVFSGKIPFLIVVGIIGLVGTSYFITRLVSTALSEMRKKNS